MGIGKGVGTLLPNLLTADRSVLCIDPKGDNARIAGRARRRFGPVHVLDPFGVTEGPSAAFNPLDALDPDSLDLAEDAAALADSLVHDDPGAAGEAHWNEEAKALIAGLLLHIVTHEPPERRTLATLRDHLTLPHHAEMTGGGPFRLRPGQWTDDTSMALALAESLIAHPGLDARDLMDRFLGWWRRGDLSCTGTCFDIGIATREALERYERGGDPFAGSTDPRSAGNGSIMRLAPAVLRAPDDPAEARRLATEQSRTTHAAPQAVEACAFLADLLLEAIRGTPKGALLAPRGWDGDAAIAGVAGGGWRGRDRSAIRSSGYVVHTLEAALWAVERTGSFEEALVLAVNLADDADSVGAVTGQLAGALYGMEGIPARWLAPLAWRERLVGLADALLAGEEGR